MSFKREIVYSNHTRGELGDFPIAVAGIQETGLGDPVRLSGMELVVDPIFNDRVTNNLYGRIMTLVEATTDTNKLKAVKDLFGKEIASWATDVYSDAREIANNGDSSGNIYTRNTLN